MASLDEILGLKDKLISLLFTCLDLKSSEMPTSKASQLSKNESAGPEGEDLFLVFSRGTRSEMIEIINQITQLVASNAKASSLDDNSALQLIPANSADPENVKQSTTTVQKLQSSDSKVDISAKPLQQIALSKSKRSALGDKTDGSPSKGTKGMRGGDHERAKLAVGFYVGTNPTPDISRVAKKFSIKLTWLANSLLDSGVELPPSYVSKLPFCFLRKDQASLSVSPTGFSLLSSEIREQLTQEATQWINSGPHRLHIDKADKLKVNQNLDMFKQLTAEQRQDMLDFYLKYRDRVTFPWIVEQAAEKYRIRDKGVARIVALSMLEKAGKEIKLERSNKKYYKFEDKKDMILNYARSHKPDDLCLTHMLQIFDIKCTLTNLSRFLKENGVEVLTPDQRRAKRLAEKGLPYTRTRDPEKERRYQKTQKEKRKASTTAGGGPTLASCAAIAKPKRQIKRDPAKRNVTKSSSSMKRTHQQVAVVGTSVPQEQWVVEYHETDQGAIARLASAADQHVAAAGHQYETRTTSTRPPPPNSATAYNATQFYQTYY